MSVRRLSKILGLYSTALLVTACGVSSGSSPDLNPPVAQSTTSSIEPRAADATFEDILAEYQALNERLHRVAAPLRLKNAHLCPRTERDPGFLTHRLSDYPPRLQEMAKVLLKLKATGVFIRTVRKDSPADKADIEAGDQLLKLNDIGIVQPSSERTSGAADKFYRALSQQAFEAAQTRLTLKTQAGHIYQTSLNAQTACAVPVNVVFSEEINGHTDGTEIIITSALMRAVADDTNLALIIAHEMGHIIAGHASEVPSQLLELEADRMALVLMENAGYDIDSAITYWQDAIHPHRKQQGRSNSHPSIEARLLNFTTERARIRQQQATGQTLSFR